MYIKSYLLILILLGINPVANAQKDPVAKPEIIKSGIFLGVTPPLKKIPPLKYLTRIDQQRAIAKREKWERNSALKKRLYPNAANALPKGIDPLLQKSTRAVQTTPVIDHNFSGQNSYSDPPDCNGAVGPNHYMQTINVYYTIYDKTGNLLVGPNDMNTLFSGVTGSNCNDGDPIILYDDQAGRWLAAEFSVCNSNNVMLVAVSSTNDPTGTWYKYSFDVDDMPDYEKFGIWQDGYYMSTNNASGKDVYVFERSVMLTGGASPKMIGFSNPNRPATDFVCIMPLDNDMSYAPSGSPGLFITMNDDAWGSTDALWIYELNANWTTPASSTFSRVQVLPVSAFDSNFGPTWENITQKGTTQKLDAIPQVLMFRAQYLNFGTYQTMVCCHNVDVDNTDHAGVRWYELRKTGSSWAVRQSGTYAPDAHSRWMAGISMNQNHEIGLAYSISSSTVYPGIRFTGQTSAENANATGILDIDETVLQAGSASQTTSERWGDYVEMCIDPADNTTFWFTTEYNLTSTERGTKISAFHFPFTSSYCSGTTNLSDCFGTLDEGSGANDYTNNSNCKWLIQPVGATSVTLNFTSLNTEASMDLVKVYDGVDTTATLLGTFSGTTIPMPVSSSGGSMLVHFTANASVTGSGWAAGYSGNNCLSLTLAHTDVSCMGQNNGTATATPNGGTAPYTYSWNTVPSQNTASVTNLYAGIYRVTVTDNSGTTASLSVEISQPAVLLITPTVTHVSCGGTNNGNIDITVTGGNAPYTYNWSNSATTEDISALSAGSYTVSVTDNKNCSSSLTSIVSQQAISSLPFQEDFEGSLFVPTGWTSNNPDNDLGWEKITAITGSSGSPTSAAYINHYNYSNNIGSTDELITPVFNLNGTNNPLLSFDLAYARYSATDAEKLKVLLSIDCGVTFPNILYNKSGLDTDGNTLSTTATNSANFIPSNSSEWRKENMDLSAYKTNSIVLKLESTNGYGNNIFIDNFMITDEELGITFSYTDPSCPGKPDAIVNLTVTGGSTPFSFGWSNGATTQSISGLISGSYSVTVTDSKGLSGSKSIILSDPQPISITSAITFVSCNGGTDGAIDISIAGGIFPYSYLWSNGAVTEDISSLSSGNYQVTVTDSKNCSYLNSISVSEQSPIILSALFSNPTCKDLANGSINMTVSGGNPPLSYSWNNGTLTEDLINLPAGTYLLTVTDSKACSHFQSTVLTDPAGPLALPFQENFEDSLALLFWKINNPDNGLTWERYTGITGIKGNITSGIYLNHFNYSGNVGGKDELVSQSIQLAGSLNPILEFDLSYARYSGTEAEKLRILLSTDCGATFPNVLFNKSGLDIEGNTLTTAGTLSNSFYPTDSGQWRKEIIDLSTYKNDSVILKFETTNGYGNNIFLDNITLYDFPPVSISSSVTAVTCFGGTDGEINLTVSGGFPPYIYSWSNGENTRDLAGLSPATYSVTITDVKSNTTTLEIPVPDGKQIFINFSNTASNCSMSNGASSALPMGDYPPFIYSWSNGIFSADNTNISSGIFTVTVTDSKSCTVSASTFISDQEGPSFVFSVTDITCFQGNDGMASVSINSGNPPYIFEWNTGDTTTTIDSLSAGEYSILVKDSSGCFTFNSFNLIAPLKVNINLYSSPPSCNGFSDGMMMAQTSGGTAPYNYLWNTPPVPQTDSIAVGLEAGIYSVTVSDKNGCTATQSGTLSSPSSLSLTTAGGNPSCNGDTNGGAIVFITGGTPGYSNVWSTGDTSSEISNLGTGTYFITVTDEKFCVKTDSVVLVAPTVLTTTLNITHPSCAGTSDGYLFVLANGGNPGYSFSWSNGTTLSNINNLPAGNYSYTVTDSKGCFSSGDTTLIDPEILQDSIAYENPNCFGSTDGSVSISASGGASPYFYSWNTGKMNPSLFNLSPGEYQVTVTDSKGCTLLDSLTLIEPDLILADSSIFHAGCSSCNDGKIIIVVSAGAPPYSFLWSNGSLSKDSIVNLIPGNYSLTLTDSNNCAITLSGMVVSFPDRGIKKLPEGFSLYPNPVYDKLYIEIYNGANLPVEISIENLIGQEMFKQIYSSSGNGKRSMVIGMEKFPSSLYVVRIKSGEQSYFIKVYRN